MIRVHLQLVCDACGTPIDVTALGPDLADVKPVSDHEIVRDRLARWRVRGNSVTCDGCVEKRATVNG